MALENDSLGVKKLNRRGTLDVLTEYTLIGLAFIVIACAFLRIFGITSRLTLDETTLYYLAAAGALLLYRQIKSFSFGQLKFERLEILERNQSEQAENLKIMRQILPLLLPPAEIRHMENLSNGTTNDYYGGHSLRSELHRLASIGLISRKQGKRIGALRSDTKFDLADHVELTDLGREWVEQIKKIDPV